ncbi:hypothetical protein [Candidatus Wolbachia massiliensis]|uniref:Uncharacterized protein n=1 Tax=Candidatus Wolbachia massiliensis TaxID=1845000 RepID=A0A7L7YMB9_9RICK|nr:hypothetical protein [Candidatus Wolbachia massiliensis]QOD38208.1 hypothetical protein ID128_05450 [Candidatus Wolbachia massiliensis]
MRGTKNRHDCANDGTCGQSIQNYEIGSTNIFFLDNHRNLIAEIPKLPKYSGEKYGHRLYKEDESKQFYYPPTNIYDVLPNSFAVKHGYINCTIKYDNLSEQERNQIETDIKTSYEAFKAKFCLENRNASYNITIHIFNNRSDYIKYNDLLSINEDGGQGYITRGVTDYRNILTYKQQSMDFVLGHELGHIFQLRFAPAEKVRGLYYEDTELIANVVGRDVEEKNHKTILEQNRVIQKPYKVDYASSESEHAELKKEEQSKVEEEKSNQQNTQQSSNFLSNIIFPAIKCIVESISSLFSWLFWSKEEEQLDDNLVSFEFNVNDNVVENFVDNHHLSDYPPDELI